MSQIQKYKVLITTSLPIEQMQRLEDFMHRHRVKRKTDAINELLRLAFYVESKMGLVDSIGSEELQVFKEQIEKGQLVDYISQIDHQKFNIIMNIIKDEEKARLKVQAR